MKGWTNPKYAELVDYISAIREKGSDMANCGYCNGLGRTIVIDPNTKKTHTVTCTMCKGSGEKQD